MKKDLRQFLADLAKLGWGVEYRKAGHYRLTGPRGQLVFTSSTPSDGRTLLNLQALVRRA